MFDSKTTILEKPSPISSEGLPPQLSEDYPEVISGFTMTHNNIIP
jgi:hypothetical protein